VSLDPTTIIPEKCEFSLTDPTVAVCGIYTDEFPDQMPDVWYKGDVQMNDSLWEYSTGIQAAALLISPEDTTGRQLDIVRQQFGIDDTNLYFQNKVDQTLWIYEHNLFDSLN